MHLFQILVVMLYNLDIVISCLEIIDLLQYLRLQPYVVINHVMSTLPCTNASQNRLIEAINHLCSFQTHICVDELVILRLHL